MAAMIYPSRPFHMVYTKLVDNGLPSKITLLFSKTGQNSCENNPAIYVQNSKVIDGQKCLFY